MNKTMNTDNCDFSKEAMFKVDSKELVTYGKNNKFVTANNL